MRWEEISNLLIQYGGLVLVAAAVVLALFLLQAAVLRKNRRGRETLPIGQLAVRALLWGYMLTLAVVTLVSRSDMYATASLVPLSTYVSAWNHMSLREWQMIGLNILMFVPLGFLLPLAFPRFQPIFRTLGAGALTALCIEGLQLLTRRGIFEFDDLLNNFWGCIVGYFLLRTLQNLITMMRSKGMFSNHEKDSYRRRAIAALLVSLTPAMVFGSLYLTYQQKEFGNLDMRSGGWKPAGELRWAEDIKALPMQANVYRTTLYTAQEAQEAAAQLAKRAGFLEEPVRHDVYNDNALYFFEDENGASLSVWMYFQGGLYSARFHDVTYDPTDYGDRRPFSGSAAAKKLSEAMGVSLPEGAKLTAQPQPGQYEWTVDQLQEGTRGGALGSLQLELTAEGTVASLHNGIYHLTAQRQVALVSRQTVLQRLRRGEFQIESVTVPQRETQQEPLEEGESQEEQVHKEQEQEPQEVQQQELPQDLNIERANLTYQKDTKGFLRPVFRLMVTDGAQSAQDAQNAEKAGTSWMLIVSAD